MGLMYVRTVVTSTVATDGTIRHIIVALLFAEVSHLAVQTFTQQVIELVHFPKLPNDLKY
jgi:signal recognition particle GTPase